MEVRLCSSEGAAAVGSQLGWVDPIRYIPLRQPPLWPYMRGVADMWPSVLASGVDGECVNGLSGTSYATPLVSGVIALMLEANPKLNWREVQDILARTAHMVNPGDEEWVVNGAGLHHSYKFS